MNQFAEAQHTTSEKHNYCCKYTVNVERTLFRSLFRDHTPVTVKPQLDVPWSHEPIKIPVLGTANVGASDGGEIWLSADSLGRLTSTCAGNSSRHITGSGDTKSGAPVSTIGGGSDIDWLLRLPWHVVIMARDKMGWKEIVSDTHLALVTDSDNQEKVRYVVRAKVLDENGVTCPFAISDPTQCSDVPCV